MNGIPCSEVNSARVMAIAGIDADYLYLAVNKAVLPVDPLVRCKISKRASEGVSVLCKTLLWLFSVLVCFVRLS